jgi:hypothetical protein
LAEAYDFSNKAEEELKNLITITTLINRIAESLSNYIKTAVSEGSKQFNNKTK